jgi:acyl carrier protein
MKIGSSRIDRAAVIEALSQITSISKPDELADDANLLELGHIDSLQFLDLVSLLEERTGTEIDFLTIDPAGITSINGLIRNFEAE